MDEGGGRGWGGVLATTVLAAPRIMEWQLGSRTVVGAEEEEAVHGRRNGQEGDVTAALAGWGVGNTKNLKTLLESSGQQILKFYRSKSDMVQLRKQSRIAQATYLEADALLVARYWDLVLAPFESPFTSISPPPSSSSSLLLSSPDKHTGMPRYIVKELQFESDCVKGWDAIPRLARVLSIGSTVKILRMEPTYRWDLLHLLPLMDALPALEELYVEPRRCTERPWPLAPKRLVIPARHLMPLAETRIRVLVVFGVALTLPAMEAVVRRIPRVEVLKFMQTVDYSREQRDLDPAVSRSEFWPHLRDWCKQLQELHYSKSNEYVQTSEMDALRLALVPSQPSHTHSNSAGTGGGKHSYALNNINNNRYPYRPSVLGLSSSDIIPFQSYLTSFNCEWLAGLRFDRIRTGISLYNQNVVHKALCSCPNLITFTALGIYYYIEDMDVNNLLAAKGGGKYRKKDDDPVVRSDWSARICMNPYPVPRPGSNPPPDDENQEPVWPRRVWTCRNLRTLHISISAQGKGSGSHAFSLVLFGYLSRVCPRLEELNVKMEKIMLDDESGLCLLGRLKFLERLQIQSTSNLRYPDVAWLRRRKLESVGAVHLDGAVQDLQKQQQKQRQPQPETLLERLATGSRNQWVRGHPVTTPSAYLKKLPPLPAFQKEQKPFWTVDGFDLGGVGRPDDLVSWLINTNKDLITTPLDSQEQLDLDQVQNDDDDDGKSRDEACLPRLDLLYIYHSSNDGLATADAERFMWTQRPEVDFRADIVNYHG
ncbi:hypothetical protein BGX24_004080 [Mortierella sp. AD032]|nr:hypothetical protein BGX24_004080 [Mortierella sp. AD032]